MLSFFRDDGPARKGKFMSKYFMQDTRHAALERMMMSVPLKRDNSGQRKKPRNREKKNPGIQREGGRK